ncbi:MAG TPA: serine protease, partial [Capillimicrobium sp.]
MRRLLAAVAAAAACALACPPASSAADPRIVGGQDADIASWPFLAAIVRADRADAFQGQFCGGSLVAPRVVLTAAHCIDGREIDVLLGRTVLSGDGGERIRVVEQALAPGYDAQTNRPDLALLVLERAATAAPVPLAVAPPAPGTGVQVAGWGYVEQQPREISADTLQQAALQVLPGRRCGDAFGPGFAGREMVCAGTPEGGRPDSCNGDSGGPLVTRDLAGAPT